MTMDSFPTMFPAATANPVFYRTYSRKKSDGSRETWEEVCDRTIKDIAKLGNLTSDEIDLIKTNQYQMKCLPSGRWLWVGGVDWINKPENYSGAYNCTSTNLTDWHAFSLIMDLAMMGSGTGAVIEDRHIGRLPAIRNRINLTLIGTPGDVPKAKRQENTSSWTDGKSMEIVVGDSRSGWVSAYKAILQSSSVTTLPLEIEVKVDLSHIRKSGEKLNGFGGVANPIKLREMFTNCVAILNNAKGRRLTSVECCLLIDHAAAAVVAGNIRRSAGMRQFGSSDTEGAIAKDNLWQQDAEGKWRIAPERDVLRMANHTRVFHRKPTLEECIDSVRKQYYSGEGAIQWAGEAVLRGNRDIIKGELKASFLKDYQTGKGNFWLAGQFPHMSIQEIEHRVNRYGLNPCGEIIGSDFHCNLAEVHLNQIDPKDDQEQKLAFKAGAIAVASLLNHKFKEPRYQKSRELDPIVGVSFTGLFDFFVHAFGVEWLQWWAEGRPDTPQGIAYKEDEARYLSKWRKIVEETVWEYCDRHKLKRPNRCTTVQPSGTKSLLTGASPGWHPPKSARFIRRITFGKNDPVALACIDYGYNVIPSQSDKDENGNLLNDPFDPRVTEWLVEIPVSVSWADLPGAELIDISKFSAIAQFDFAMQVQKYYTRHNTSSTIELREGEILPLAERIYQAIQNDEGYISFALLARFDDLQTFPRLPFEPISKEDYKKMEKAIFARRAEKNFHRSMMLHDAVHVSTTMSGPAGCDSDKCMLPETAPIS